MNTDLVVFILSHNRPLFLKEALDSILEQSYSNFKVIISDNSTDDSVFNSLGAYRQNTQVEIIRRTPPLPPTEHFSTILIEGQKFPYFMMFHDDDLMLPDCLEKLMTQIKFNLDIAAVGCNAMIKTNQDSHRSFNSNLKENLVISTPQQMLERYLNPRLSHIPFPFYIYNANLVKSITFDPNEGGKNCDLSFLCKVVEAGPICWLSEPLALYRRHQENDSAKISMKDLFSLARFVFSRYHDFYLRMSYFILKSFGVYLKSYFKPTQL